MKTLAENTTSAGGASAARAPSFGAPPQVQIAPPTRLPSDAQRATFERAGGGRGANPLKLCSPSKQLGIAALQERRAPKRVVALLDVAGRRIRWDRDAGEWQLHPWRFDPCWDDTNWVPSRAAVGR